MLSEDADHLLGGVVGSWDVMAFDRIDQVGPMAFQEVEDESDVWHLCDEGLSLSQHLVIPSLGCALGTGIEDMVNILLECVDFQVTFSVI